MDDDVSAPETTVTKKFADMEALRGFAALGVVIYHYLYGFVPVAGNEPGWSIAGMLIVDRPYLIAVINGPFMVAIFFVLSSFVLTNRLVRQPDQRAAAIAMVKRFPRLFPLTLIGVALPALLFAAGWTYNHELAEAIGSPWLAESGGVKDDDGWPAPSVAGGLRDSVALFGRGLSQYNSALWTMKYELIGSLFALATAMVFGGRHQPLPDAAMTFILAAAGLLVHPLVAICVMTVFITKYVVVPDFRLSRRAVAACLIAGVALGTTYKSLPEELLTDPWTRRQVLRTDWLLHGAGAILLFVGIRGAAAPAADGGFVGRQLARLSFPIYVLHLPIFASVASAIILFSGYSEFTVAAAFFVSMAVLFAVSVPAAMLDEWWVRTLNTMMRRLQPDRPRAAALTPDPAP